MKIILNPILNKSLLRIGGLALSVLLAVSMMAAALPQPALAAGPTTVPCAEKYKIQEEDTKSTIADSFKMKWWQIAAANDLAPNAKLVIGSTLCIPTKAWARSYGLGTMSASATGKKLTVTMSDFNKRGIWNIKVKDATGKGFFKVGMITAPQKGSATGIYNLPQQLRTTPRLRVCVTNVQTSITICKVINHLQ